MNPSLPDGVIRELVLRFKICGRNNTKKWREDSESRGKGTGYTTEVTAELLASLEALRVYMFVGRPGGGGSVSPWPH